MRTQSAIVLATLACLALSTRAVRATETVTPTETPTAIDTPTPTCAPTGTPYCAETCVPCPTIRPDCFAVACGACLEEAPCPGGEVRPTCGLSLPCINCPCVTVTPTPTPTSTPLCLQTPRPGCRTPGTSTVLLNDGKDKLVWKWLKGAATDLAALGNPVAGDTDYAACIYSTTGGIPALVMSALAPGGSSCGGDFCWRPIRTKGFKYIDPPGTANGLTKIVLRTGTDGEAKVIVQGKGPALPIPPPADMNTLIRQDPTVTVQVVNSEGQCWEAPYSAPATKQTVDLFKDGF